MGRTNDYLSTDPHMFVLARPELQFSPKFSVSRYSCTRVRACVCVDTGRCSVWSRNKHREDFDRTAPRVSTQMLRSLMLSSVTVGRAEEMFTKCWLHALRVIKKYSNFFFGMPVLHTFENEALSLSYWEPVSRNF